MIDIGQRFQCYHLHNPETIDGVEVNHSMTLGFEDLVDKVDMAGEIAFNGRVFTCEEVKTSGERGIYIVAQGFELRRDCFRFRSVK